MLTLKLNKTRLAIALLWFTCGFFAWGIFLAEDRHELKGYSTAALDCRHSQSFAIMWGEAGGPVALVIALTTSGFAEYGMQWTCPAKEVK